LFYSPFLSSTVPFAIALKTVAQLFERHVLHAIFGFIFIEAGSALKLPISFYLRAHLGLFLKEPMDCNYYD